MQFFTIIWTCLACMGVGRRLQHTTAQLQADSGTQRREPKSVLCSNSLLSQSESLWRAVATSILAFNWAPSVGKRFPVLNPTTISSAAFSQLPMCDCVFIRVWSHFGRFTRAINMGDDRARLFVGGIPYSMSETEVARIFDGIALPHETNPVVHVRLRLNDRGASSGYGFVELATPAQADRAKAMLDGRVVSYGSGMPTRLVVKDAAPTAESDKPFPPIAGRMLFVRNLNWVTRTENVRDLFADAGGVSPESVWCRLKYDRKTGLPLGTASVRFPDTASAAAALAAMDGAEFDGRDLVVGYHNLAGPPSTAKPVPPGGVVLQPPASSVVDSIVVARRDREIVDEKLAKSNILNQTRLQLEILRQRQLHRQYLLAVAEAEKPAPRITSFKPYPTRQNYVPRVIVFDLSVHGTAKQQQRLIAERIERTVEPAARVQLETLVTEAPGVHVPGDRFGRSRGLAFLSARSVSEAVRWLALLNNTELQGRVITAQLEEWTMGDLEVDLPAWRPVWLEDKHR